MKTYFLNTPEAVINFGLTVRLNLRVVGTVFAADTIKGVHSRAKNVLFRIISLNDIFVIYLFVILYLSS